MPEENKNEEGVVKETEGTDGKNAAEETSTEVREDVKTPEEVAADLLKGDGKKRILVDQDRFNEINEQAKLYKGFAPIIDKAKGNPKLVEELLETNTKGSLEERVARMEEDRRATQQSELRDAVRDSVVRWPGFDKDWPELRDQVDMLIRRGLPAAEAMRRSYIALHPEVAEVESKRIATERQNADGTYRSSGGRAPTIKTTEEKPNLTGGELAVAKLLMGRDFGNGKALFKSEEEYAFLLKKHQSHLKAKGMYQDFLDIPEEL